MNTNNTMYPIRVVVELDIETYFQLRDNLSELRNYIKTVGAKTKYTQPEKFATTCLDYCSRIEKLLEKDIQYSEDRRRNNNEST